MSSHVLAAENFLVPNGTLIAELVIFLLILGVIWRYVVPPVKRVMNDRQEMVRKQIEESREASERLEAAESRYREALAEARDEAAQIRDSARADAQQIKEELREQADQEVARIRQRGEEQLVTQREQTVRELRAELGDLAVTLAGRLVGESLADDSRRSATVDSFLDELEGMSAREGESAQDESAQDESAQDESAPSGTR